VAALVDQTINQLGFFKITWSLSTNQMSVYKFWLSYPWVSKPGVNPSFKNAKTYLTIYPRVNLGLTNPRVTPWFKAGHETSWCSQSVCMRRRSCRTSKSWRSWCWVISFRNFLA